MAGFFEISTIRLTENELTNFIDNAKKAEGFKELKSKISYQELRTNQLPILSGYEFHKGKNPNEFGFHHDFTQPESVKDIFLELLDIKDILVSITCTFYVNDSEKKYNRKEERDAEIVIGCDRFGYVLGFDIGKVNPGSEDLNYRKELFNNYVTFAGREEKMEFDFEEGELAIKIKDKNIETPQLGLNDWRSSSNCLVSNVLRYSGNINRRNMKSFSLYLFNEDDIRSFYDKTLDKYGAKILGGHIYFALNEENYEKIYALERIRNMSWKTSLFAKSKYSLGSLDEALKENESLLLSLFTLRTRKTGKLEVSICKDENGIHLNFVAEMKKDNNKQEKAIHELIQEIADGKDIINHTPT